MNSEQADGLLSVEMIRKELERRMEVDERARRPVVGASEDPRTELWARVDEVDTDNTAWLHKVIEARGWPLLSEVGERAATAAWLIAQHADDVPDLQRLFHGLLAAAVERGEASAKSLAYLEDRVRVNDGRPQLYGTQFTDAGGGLAPSPIEEREGLDQRRQAVGLEPFAEYEADMLEIWGGGALSDDEK